MVFELKTINEILEINPTTKLAKGTIAKKVAMEHIKEHQKYINTFDVTEFKGGSKFKNNDVLVARITPCLENGKTAFVDVLEKEEVAFGSTEYFVIRNIINISDAHYLYYLMRTPIIRETLIKSMTGTSGRQRAQKEALLNFQLPVPSLKEQIQIARTLSNLDDKIRLNQQIIANLEELSQTLFKRWFIDFEFPDEYGNAYKSSGGIIVEKMGRHIPSSWNIVSLLDIMNYEGGTQPASKYFSDYPQEGYIRLIQIRDFDNSNHLTYIPKTEKLKRTTEEDIMIARYGAALGRILYGLEGSYNVALVKIIPHEEYYKEFLRNYLKTQEFYKSINNSGGRSAQSGFNKSDIKALKIAIPDNISILRDFQEISYPIFKSVLQLRKESIKLGEMRDTLLPKLMSGEIELPDELEADKHAELLQ